jgi:hypothetical protein
MNVSTQTPDRLDHKRKPERLFDLFEAAGVALGVGHVERKTDRVPRRSARPHLARREAASANPKET